AKPATPPFAPQVPVAPAAPPPSAAPTPLAVPPVEHRFEEPRPPVAARAATATASGSEINEVVVTSERRNLSRGEKTEQLRGAAEAGRADEVAALLAEGTPVDLPDEAGDTALMKSVRADHPAAAVLLRRHGASLDRRNHAGESARSLAATVGDPELDQALSLKR
ncbi:MAG TPA: ankyrin repeat domain-containing protein, partial [Chloroflexota bacterium]|nr:ankyrin repeat domain-containing protein [Chloroflexota bacterium]